MNQAEIKQKIKEAIEEDPNKSAIGSVFLFGSFLHGDNDPESDIDLLFEMKKTLSLFKIIDVQDRLEKKLGRKVDFIEKDSLDKYIKDDVLAEAKQIL